jgi:hypothetical protein
VHVLGRACGRLLAFDPCRDQERGEFLDAPVDGALLRSMVLRQEQVGEDLRAQCEPAEVTAP